MNGNSFRCSSICLYPSSVGISYFFSRPSFGNLIELSLCMGLKLFCPQGITIYDRLNVQSHVSDLSPAWTTLSLRHRTSSRCGWIRLVAILNKQSWTADEGWSRGLSMGLTTTHCEKRKLVTKPYTESRGSQRKIEPQPHEIKGD